MTDRSSEPVGPLRPAGASADAGQGPVALFGTSADPPTQGHRSLLQGLRGVYPLVVTWASDNPMKRHTAPLELRQQLLAAMVEALADPDLRLLQALSSPWAVDTVARARRLWPQRELVFVIGSDLVPQLPRWRQAQDLLAACTLAVAPRAGWPLQAAELEALRQLGGRIELLPLEIPATASSALRGGGDPVSAGQLPAELWPLLLQHNPYGLVQP